MGKWVRLLRDSEHRSEATKSWPEGYRWPACITWTMRSSKYAPQSLQSMISSSKPIHAPQRPTDLYQIRRRREETRRHWYQESTHWTNVPTDAHYNVSSSCENSQTRQTQEYAILIGYQRFTLPDAVSKSALRTMSKNVFPHDVEVTFSRWIWSWSTTSLQIETPDAYLWMLSNLLH